MGYCPWGCKDLDMTERLTVLLYNVVLGFPGGSVVKNLPANDRRDVSLIPGFGRSRGGHGNSLQYSCLENPMDRGPCWAIVHSVAKCWTRLK